MVPLPLQSLSMLTGVVANPLPAAIPKFMPTSSPELDTLLESIRFKVFLPSYLNKSQSKLVRSTKARTQLESDPVFATFGEEEIRLTHLDITKDMPRKTVLLQFKDMANGSKDWANLPALLEGWHHARPNTPTSTLTKVVTQASEAGQVSTIVQCLWQVEKNGLSLADPDLRFTVIQSIRGNAMRSGWGKSTNKGFKQIQTVLELMEKPGHCGSRTVSDSDPRADVLTIGVALELAARRAQYEFAGKDEEGHVATYFTRLTSALDQQKSESVRDNRHCQSPRANTSSSRVFPMRRWHLLPSNPMRIRKIAQLSAGF